MKKNITVILLIMSSLCRAQEWASLTIEECAWSDQEVQKAAKKIYVESFSIRPDISATPEELAAKFENRVKLIEKHRLLVRVLGAVRDDQMVGVLVGVLRKNGAVYIHLIAVLPTEQRQGIGRKLLNACIERWNPESLELNVQKTNKRAQVFYKKYGFVDLGHNPALLNSGKNYSKEYLGLVWHKPEADRRTFWRTLFSFRTLRLLAGRKSCIS